MAISFAEDSTDRAGERLRRTDNDVRLLLNRPRPLRDESLAGYLVRLALVNYHQCDWMLELIGFSGEAIQATKPNLGFSKEHIRLLSQLVKVSSRVLNKMTLDRFIEPLRIESNKQLEDYLDSHTKFCPVCLKAKPYHKLHWDLRPVTLCLKHSALLVDECSECKGPITVKHVVTGRHECHHRLANEAVVPLDPAEPSWRIQSYVAGLLGIEHGCRGHADFSGDPFDLPPLELLLLLEMLTETVASWHQVERPIKSALGNEDRHRLMGEVFEKVLKNWPANFYTFLDKYRKSGDKKHFPNLSGDYRPFGRVLEKSKQEGYFPFVRTKFIDYLTGTLKVAISKGNRFLVDDEERKYVSKNEAANIIKITRNEVTKLRSVELRFENSRLVELDSIKKLKSRLDEDSYTLRKAADLLKVELQVINELVKKEWLKQGWDESNVKVLTKKSVDKIITYIRWAWVTMGFGAGPFMTMKEVQDNLSDQQDRTSQVLFLMTEGDAYKPLRAYKDPDPSKWGLLSLRFLLSDVEDLAAHDTFFRWKTPIDCEAKRAKQRKERPGMSEDETANLLCITPAHVQELAARGFLSVIEGEEPARLDAKATRAFSQQYVVAEMAASMLGLSSAVLLRWIEAGFVKKVIKLGPGGMTKYFVEDQEIKDLYPDKRVSRPEASKHPAFEQGYGLTEVACAGLLKPLPEITSPSGFELFLSRDLENVKEKKETIVSQAHMTSILNIDKTRLARLVDSGAIKPIDDGGGNQDFTQLDLDMCQAVCDADNLGRIACLTPDEIEDAARENSLSPIPGSSGKGYRVLDILEYRISRKGSA